MAEIIYYFGNLEVMWKYLPPLLDGFWLTVQLALLIITAGISIGFGLACLRAFRVRPINWLIVFTVDLFRAIPPLVIIILIYFGLPYLELRPSSFTSTAFTLIMVLAAFSEEIFWAGITSVDKGQWEAARSTGLGFSNALFLVVVPQGVRLAIPPLTNRTIAITKGTALGSVVAVQEILSQAVSAQSLAANPSPLTLGALLYLVIFAPMVILSRWIETRFGWTR